MAGGVRSLFLPSFDPFDRLKRFHGFGGRLQRLQLQLSNWPGPASAGLFVEKEATATVNSQPKGSPPSTVRPILKQRLCNDNTHAHTQRLLRLLLVRGAAFSIAPTSLRPKPQTMPQEHCRG